MKNLKKVILVSFAIAVVEIISITSAKSVDTVVQVNSQESSMQLASVVDWSEYDFNSLAEVTKCGGEKKSEDKKCGGDKADKEKKSEKCGAGKCGGDKESKEKKSEKCGTGKCGKA